jgi:hypothetical protein
MKPDGSAGAGEGAWSCAARAAGLRRSPPGRRAEALDVVVVGLLGMLGLGAAGACGTSPPPTVDFSSTPPTYAGTDYPEVYQRWTRHGKVLHEFEAALEVWATYKSFDFREAYVAHYAEAYRLSTADRELIHSGQREIGADAYEFMVTAQSANYKWNDLERKGSAWRVTLVDGLGHEIAPEKISSEKLPETYEREFFPAKTPFTRIYVVRFSRHPPEVARAPATAGTGAPAVSAVASSGEDGFVGERSGRLVLRLAGPFGSLDLVWSTH